MNPVRFVDPQAAAANSGSRAALGSFPTSQQASVSPRPVIRFSRPPITWGTNAANVRPLFKMLWECFAVFHSALRGFSMIRHARGPDTRKDRWHK